jgi:hypothetical protein
MRSLRSVPLAVSVLAWVFPAAANPTTPPMPSSASSTPEAAASTTATQSLPSPAAGGADDVRSEIPSYAYAYTAYGAAQRTLGAQAYGLGLSASRQRGIVGGGLTLWGSPIDRLTILGDGQRDLFGNFTPSMAVVVRILGTRGEGWSLGALGRFKVEGFGSGTPTGAGTPASHPGEVESEVETGLLASYARRGGVHLDLNAIAGMGTGDDGEVDAEARLRLGYDLSDLLRLGIDSQARLRLNGPRYLPNGGTWDFAAGPQAILGSKNFFASATTGPTTMGLLTDRVGWNAIVSVGGTTF